MYKNVKALGVLPLVLFKLLKRRALLVPLQSFFHTFGQVSNVKSDHLFTTKAKNKGVTLVCNPCCRNNALLNEIIDPCLSTYTGVELNLNWHQQCYMQELFWL